MNPALLGFALGGAAILAVAATFVVNNLFHPHRQLSEPQRARVDVRDPRR